VQLVSDTQTLRDEINNLAVLMGLDKPCYSEMLDFTIDLFESQGLGMDYYGYHNIEHELEVTYVTLVAANWKSSLNPINQDDLKYLYTAALFHDFDPEKSVDKPHEESVIKFLTESETLKKFLNDAEIDLNIIKALILRTTFPWKGTLKENAEKEIKKCFENSEITKNNPQKQDHYMRLGWFLSIVDRVSGYALGDFSKGMEMAKKNAHALAWHPSLIFQRSVAYFEDLLNNESEMCERVLSSIPKHMRKNFMNNVLSFLNLRQQEIQIHANFVYDNLKIVPTIEQNVTRTQNDFVTTLRKIYDELPKPLQMTRDNFEETVRDPDTIISTIRLTDTNGPIIGFAKGGPLEKYEVLHQKVNDENFGKKNTIFLEPLAIKMGYWGHHGGSELRHLFTMQAHSKRFKYQTSFALRDVISKRSKTHEEAKFVTQFDPERWDYYRIEL
jgi:hypothetical protein